jgi:hypothetical protein
LASIRSGDSIPKGPGQLQKKDMKDLRDDLISKKSHLNELREGNMALRDRVVALETSLVESQCLAPTEEGSLVERCASVEKELESVNREFTLLELKNQQYLLLQRRTQVDRDASQANQRQSLQLRDACLEDIHSLIECIHHTRASKEATERELAKAMTTMGRFKDDWHKKLDNRRKEVRELERAKAGSDAAEAARVREVEEKKRVEREKAETVRQAQVAKQEARFSTVIPRLESLESLWMQLRAVSGITAINGGVSDDGGSVNINAAMTDLSTGAEHIASSFASLIKRNTALTELLKLAQDRYVVAVAELEDVERQILLEQQQGNSVAERHQQEEDEDKNREPNNSTAATNTEEALLAVQETIVSAKEETTRLSCLRALARQGLEAAMDHLNCHHLVDTNTYNNNNDGLQFTRVSKATKSRPSVANQQNQHQQPVVRRRRSSVAAANFGIPTGRLSVAGLIQQRQAAQRASTLATTIPLLSALENANIVEAAVRRNSNRKQEVQHKSRDGERVSFAVALIIDSTLHNNNNRHSGTGDPQHSDGTDSHHQGEDMTTLAQQIKLKMTWMAMETEALEKEKERKQLEMEQREDSQPMLLKAVYPSSQQQQQQQQRRQLSAGLRNTRDDQEGGNQQMRRSTLAGPSWMAPNTYITSIKTSMQPVAVAKIDRTEKGPSTTLPPSSASLQKVETTRLAGFGQQNNHHLFSNNSKSSGNRDDCGRMRKSVRTQKKSSLLSGVTGKSSDDEETGPMITKEMLKTKAHKVAMMVGGQSGKE